MRSRIAFAAWVAVIAVAVFQPTPGVASAVATEIGDLFVDVGAPTALSSRTHVEALLNAAMFAPAAALALLGWRRTRWAEIVVFAFAGSLTVEVVQALFLDARSAQMIDVVANTSGAVVGAALGEFVRRRLPAI